MDEDFEWENDQSKKLSQIAKTADRFLYTYDFGDNWVHEIEIEELLMSKKSVKYPICIDGKETAPLDDIGGLYGHYDVLEALNDQNHPEHDDYMSWVDRSFSLRKFNITWINDHALQRRKTLNKWFSLKSLSVSVVS